MIFINDLFLAISDLATLLSVVAAVLPDMTPWRGQFLRQDKCANTHKAVELTQLTQLTLKFYIFCDIHNRLPC